MKIERHDQLSVTILRFTGDIDLDTIDKVRTHFYELAAEGRNCIVINLAGVRFMSYAAVGVLVERVRKVRALNGDIGLVSPSLYVQRLLRMVGVQMLFQVYESETAAIKEESS